MTETPLSRRTWFLKDEPLSNLQGQDMFSHNAYVNILFTAINELTPPFTLGIFGSWGVGKSSIVNDYSDKLEESNSNTRAVTIDVWKYSDDSLRRQFLFDLQQDLHHQKLLPKGKDYVQEVYEEKTNERPGEQRFGIARIRALAVPLALTFCVALFGILVLLFLGIPSAVQAVLAAFVAPAALYLVSEFSRNVVLVSKDTITHPVYFSEDQFERKFEEIVKDAKCVKLVIIVDNLDRCSHELVVGTLSAIKTFLEPKGDQKCIFVIPCDDSAIRQHVKASYRVLSDDHGNNGRLGAEQYAVEYLRKFFSGSIKIDPFLPEEIEPYIEHLLGQMKLTEDMPDQETRDLVQMVGFLFRENPRQLKQFLNNLTSNYLLAKEREVGPSPLINPPITDNRLFLAKVVAIETQFPNTYRKFSDDDSLFLEVHSAAVTPSRAQEVKNLLKECEGWELLEGFLRTTDHVTAENPKAFFHLKQSEQEAKIPNYAQFDVALRHGDIEYASVAFEDGNEETNVARTDILLRRIFEWSQKSYTSYALNAIRVAVAVRGHRNTDVQRISREVVRTLATVPELLEKVHQLGNPRAIFEMTEYALPDHGRTVQDAHVSYITERPGFNLLTQYDQFQLEDSIAETIVDHITSLDRSQKDALRSAISSEESVRPALLEILSSTEESKEAFIELTTLTKAVRNLKAEELATFSRAPGPEDKHHSSFLVIIRCQELGDQALADQTAQKFNELLDSATAQRNDELVWYLCQVASELAALFDIAEPDYLSAGLVLLFEKYQSAEPEQKVKLVALMCRHYGRVPENGRSSIDSILFGDFIESVPVGYIAEIIALHKDPKFSDAPWEQINARLAARLAAVSDETEASNLMKSIASKFVHDDYELLMVLAGNILGMPQTRHAVRLVRQILADLPRNSRSKGLAVPVLECALSLSGHAGEPDNKKMLLDLAFQHHELHTGEYEAKLDGHILDLIVGGDPLKEVGFQVLEQEYENNVASEERCVAILRGFVDWLIMQPPTMGLQGSIPEWLDRVVNRKNRVLEDTGRRENLIRWLSDRQEQSLPSGEREHNLRHLVSFKRLSTETLQELVPKLVYQAQNSPDEPSRNEIVSSLLILYRENTPLNRDLWSDLHDYRLRLLSGEDALKKVGRRLDREMRESRRAAEQVGAGDATQSVTRTQETGQDLGLVK